jgi:hypothetical protein
MKKTKRAFSSNINIKNYKNENLKYNLDKNCLLNIKATVINSKLIHGNGYNGDYVQYWIEISTDYKKWVIKKRYSEFYELNQKLLDKIPDINELFPPKRFFKNSEDTIAERKKCFNKYLYILFRKKNIFSLNEVLDFIQIDKKIVELYIKKHTMVRQDQDNYVFLSLKKSFNRMIFLEKMDKSKSMGETININGISSLSTKVNSKEEINHYIDTNLYNINKSIMDACDGIYDVDDIHSNYYSTLLEYEENKNINEKNDEEIKTNPMYSYSLREGSSAVIEEFLKNLSQDIDNKTDILATFEEFLKQNEKWPKFSKTDIIKLYVGNINNSTINPDKKWSFCANKLNSKMKCLSGNNLNKKEFENEEMAKNKLINTKKCLSNLGKFNGSNKNNIFKDYYDSDNEDDSDSYCNLKGLFYYIGDFDNNILLSFSCLELLAKLLDNEFNPEVEQYLSIFKTRRIIDYQSMKLDEIVKNKKGGIKAKKYALKLLSILVKDKNKDMIKKALIKDENVLEQVSKLEEDLFQ